ncbi:MAG TPA: TIR domain-containing protein [Bryobacteraceae bacterium]|nr:TIR domain-containing protein [Bryobacteraceae bacterium]
MSRIFISYRREDAAGYAISIHGCLADRFGTEALFMDLGSIEPGEDFIQAITEKVGGCEVLIVVIGRMWLTCADEDGRRRLEDPTDFVRGEVSAALQRKIRVIPVLVGGASLPKPDQLVPELAPLCRRQAITLTDSAFWQDAGRLVESIEKVIGRSGNPPRPASAATRAVSRKTSLAAREARRQRPAAPVSPTNRIRFGRERIFRAHRKPVKTVAFSPDSQILASAGGGSWLGGGDTTIRLWRVADGRLLREMAGHNDTVSKVVFSPDGLRLASCCSSAINIWRLSDGKLLRALTGNETGGGDSLAFSNDSSRLACWVAGNSGENTDTTYDVWSVPKGKHLGTYFLSRLPGRGEFQWEHASSGRRMIASKEFIRIEEDAYWAIVVKAAKRGTVPLELRDNDNAEPGEWMFCPGGRSLLAACKDNVIRLWRLEDGARIARMQVSSVPNSISPDQQWVAVGCEDKTVRLWPVLRHSSTQV